MDDPTARRVLFTSENWTCVPTAPDREVALVLIFLEGWPTADLDDVAGAAGVSAATIGRWADGDIEPYGLAQAERLIWSIVQNGRRAVEAHRAKDGRWVVTGPARKTLSWSRSAAARGRSRQGPDRRARDGR